MWRRILREINLTTLYQYQKTYCSFLYPPTVLWETFHSSSHQLYHFDTSADPRCGKALHADQADAARLSPEQRKDLQRRLAEWTEVRTPKRNKKVEMKQPKIPLAWNAVDGWNPAPPAIYETLVGYSPYQLVQDFFINSMKVIFHQQCKNPQWNCTVWIIRFLGLLQPMVIWCFHHYFGSTQM